MTAKGKSGKIHLIMSVWGRPYVDLFLQLSLPSQLSKGNLPAIEKEKGAKYKIYTTLEDEAYLRKKAIFIKLTHMVETDVIAVDSLPTGDKFFPLMKFHNQAIEEADAENAALVFLSPDFIFAEGAFAKLIEFWQTGYRAVMVLTLRLTDSTIKKDLIDRYFNVEDQILSVKPRDLVKTCLAHLHPIEKTYFWSEQFSSFPIHAYWPVDNDGLIARCYYLHPIMVNPLVKHVVPKITIDADYVDMACPNRSLIHVVQDSDEICCFEISNVWMNDANSLQPAAPANVIKYARWANIHANPVFTSLLHHAYFQVPIRIHTRGRTKKWHRIEKQARKIALRVRFWTFFFRKHGGLTNALDFLLATKFKSFSVKK